MEDINIFDLVVVALVTILGLKGLFRGFTKEFFALVGIVGGVFAAFRLYKDVGEIVNQIIPMENENTILLVGFVSALVIFWIIAYTLGAILSKVFDMSGLGIFDRFLGFAFGAAKIFLIFSILAYITTQIKIVNDNLAPKLEGSVVFPLLKQTGNYIAQVDTSGFKDEVTNHLDEVVYSTKKSIVDISKEEIKKEAIELKNQLEGQINEE